MFQALRMPLWYSRAPLLCLLAVLFPASVFAAGVTNSLGMEFLLIPGGEFVMAAEEGPGRKVRISRAFYLGKYEVTQAQWAAVMGRNPSYAQGADHPVEMVSWEEAQEFIGRLNRKEGAERYRLPTEAEWEYAARAGGAGAYSFGDNPAVLGLYAWYDGNAERRHRPVGKKSPNAWGLYDMQGNVWELTQDWYAEREIPPPAVDPLGPETGNLRTARGGCYGNKARGCRVAARIAVGPGERNLAVGLRLVRLAD